ncbi:MAG: hypothetical protein J6T16_04915 [Opitutales bacterium]|nr:hypothetical protein [Opitutales bacterium]
MYADFPQISRKKKLWGGLLVGAKLRAVSCFAALRFDGDFVSLLQLRGVFFQIHQKNQRSAEGQKESK